jgi:hypothetical protein
MDTHTVRWRSTALGVQGRIIAPHEREWREFEHRSRYRRLFYFLTPRDSRWPASHGCVQPQLCNTLPDGRSLFNVARASGRQFMPGLDVPVQEEGLV